MKNTLVFSIALLLFSCKGEPENEIIQKEVKVDSSTYQILWQDEFDDTGRLDSDRWNYEKGYIRNHEKQYYTDSLKNVRIESGFLVIETHKEQVENQNFVSSESEDWKEKQEYAEYTAASVTTQDLAEWTYGKIVVRAKLPKGVGLWPAIWMLGKNWKQVGWPECGEIDIMEHVGFSQDSIFGTVHTEAFNHTKGTEVGKGVFIENPYSEFHEYTVVWAPDRIDFILDDEKYHEFLNTGNGKLEWPFDQPFHLKLNIAVGGDWGGQQGIDATIFPQRMVVDYVRVYQLK